MALAGCGGAQATGTAAGSGATEASQPAACYELALSAADARALGVAEPAAGDASPGADTSPSVDVVATPTEARLALSREFSQEWRGSRVSAHFSGSRFTLAGSVDEVAAACDFARHVFDLRRREVARVGAEFLAQQLGALGAEADQATARLDAFDRDHPTPTPAEALDRRRMARELEVLARQLMEVQRRLGAESEARRRGLMAESECRRTRCE